MNTYQLSTVYEEATDTVTAYVENDDTVLVEVHIDHSRGTIAVDLVNSTLADFAVLNDADLIRRVLNALYDASDDDLQILMCVEDTIEIQL
jgi:hypothetical protein